MNSYFKSNKKWLPEAKKFVVKFNIDVNGICSVDFDTGDDASNADALEKKQGKKYSSNNSLPTDSKPPPKFQPRAPGQQQPRPRGPPPPQQTMPQPQPQGVVRTNLARQKNSFSTSSLTSTASTNPNPRGGGGGRGTGGNRGNRGGGGNRGRGGNNNGGQNNYANLPQSPIPGFPPQLQQGYPQGFQQNNPISPNPYAAPGGNGQMHQAFSSPAPFPQQQPFYGVGNPSYPTSPQGFVVPPQNNMYPNGHFPPSMNPGYPSNAAAPPYNQQFGNPNLHQQFQNMGGFPTPTPPPPYPGDLSSNNFNEKQMHDFQKPAFSLDSSNQQSNSGFSNNQGLENFKQGNGGKEKGNSKKNAKR
uniref:Uncharacterized protein n=1 Tax=Panagrolaimus superbus TaxID=310955 RepID=A0A914YTI5_9BILA